MSNLSNSIQESSQELLNDIQYLQKTEQGLFNSLETNPLLTSEQQQTIIDKIDQITNMRITLYQTLSGVNGYFQNALTTSHGTLKDQSIAVNIVEDELNHLKKNLRTLQTEKNNKMRIVEINTYFGDKYAEHSDLMKIIIFTLVPIIILAVVNRSGIIPPIIYYILICTITAVGAYYFWNRWASIISRDPMDYDEYDWNFDASKAPKATGSDTTDPWATSGLGTCLGSACCSTGQTYDSKLDQCLGNSSVHPSNTKTPPATANPSSSTTASKNLESFVSSVLTKTSHTNKYKHGNSFNAPPKPSISPSFITYKNF